MRIYNISGNKDSELTDMYVSQLLINLIYKDDDISKWIQFIPDIPFNDTRYFIDGTKLNALGWQQTIQIIDGIKSLL